MIPRRQTELHDPANGQIGNCFSACLASLLEIEVSEVPHFTKLNLDEYEPWFRAINDWLRPRGLVYVEFNLGENIEVWRYMLDAVGYHVISGPSPRHSGCSHACVGKAGHVEWDPHPTAAGLADGYRTYGFVVRLAGV